MIKRLYHKRNIWLYFIIIALLSSLQPLNAEREYGMAGCGVGATSSGSSGRGKGQVSVASTNIASPGIISSSYLLIVNNVALYSSILINSQNMGISSGTSLCDATSSLNETTEKKERFVALNYTFLQTEIAAGQGENLRALAQLMGCQDIQSFSQMSKGNYDYFFSVPQSEPKKFIHRINEKIQTNPKLVSTCKIGA